MKNKLICSLLSSMLLIGFSSSNAQTQSAFAGFYGQISTGYESNQLGSASGSDNVVPFSNSNTTGSLSSQTFGGAPLVFGAGYLWQASDKWLIGLGADYSALTQTSSTFSRNVVNASGSTEIANGQTQTQNGASMQLSNRFNLFLTPAYAIDKEKLVYIKAGYSQVNAPDNRPTSITNTLNGVSTTTARTGGNQSSTQSGYLVGLGYKQMIMSGLYGFVEGNYMGYNAPSYSFTTPTSNATKSANLNFGSLNTYQLLIGLGYAF